MSGATGWSRANETRPGNFEHMQGVHERHGQLDSRQWLFGSHNKLEGARWIVRELLGRDLKAEMANWVYVGDSTNDQLMFEAFDNSVGVANVLRFDAQLSHKPRYITLTGRGAGFAEVAAAVLAARAG